MRVGLPSCTTSPTWRLRSGCSRLPRFGWSSRPSSGQRA